MKKLVYEVSFIIDEDELLGTTKWVSNLDGMMILNAGYRVAKPHEVRAAEVLCGMREESEVTDV